MKITKIECFVLLMPDYRVDANSSAQDNLVVKIHTDEGHVGIGETDTNPWVARAMIEARGTHAMGLGLTEMLIGADPSDVEGLWEKMYQGFGDDRPPRARHLRHRCARHGAVGPARQGRRQAVLAVARRRGQPGHHALCLAAAGRRRPRHLYAHPGRARGEGEGARLPGGEARGLHQGAVFAQFAADRGRPRDRQDRRGLPQGDRARDDGDGRRRLCLARLEGGAAGDRDVRRPGHLLHRDAAAFRRCRGLRQAGESVAHAGRRRRMAEHAFRVPGAVPCRWSRRGAARCRPRRRPDRGASRRPACGRPRPARRAALLEVGDRHRRLRASVGGVADLHAHRVPAARTRRFAGCG